MKTLGDRDNNGVPDMWEEGIRLFDFQPRRPGEKRRACRLKELQEMMEAGLITAQEYERRKAKILSEQEGDANRKAF